MLIEKLNNSQVEKETAGYIKLFKNKTTGELMYLTKDNREVVFPTEDKVLQLITDNIPSSDYTETIVTIPSSASGTITYSDGRPNATGGILGMGSSPIELLPAPGANKYYDIEKIILEFTYGTIIYNHVYSSIIRIISYETNWCYINSPLSVAGNSINTLMRQPLPFNAGESAYPSLENQYQTGVFLTTYDNEDPTLGDGTLRVKIYHKTITFGA